MRTLKLLQISPSVIRGGAEEYATAIADAAIHAGWDVHIGLPARSFTEILRMHYTDIGATYHALEVPADRRGGLQFLLQLMRTLFLLIRLRPDAVHFALPFPDQCLGSIVACAVLKVPAVVSFQLVTEDTEVGPLQKILILWSKERNQKWIAISDNNRGLLSDLFNVKREDIELIYNGPLFTNTYECSEEKLYVRNDVRGSLKIAESALVITTIGRLCNQKGYSYIIPAIPHIVKKHPNACFLWVGAGDQLEALKSQLKEYGVDGNVLFLGYRDDIPQLLAATDVFLFPSIFEGGSSIALLEAMHAGVPVVTSNASGIPEVVEDMVHGVIFRKADSCSLLMVLGWALDHPEKLAEMARNAEKRVLEFSRLQMTENTLGVIMQTVLSARESGIS